MVFCYSLLKEVIVDIKDEPLIGMLESNNLESEGNNDHNIKSEVVVE